MSEERVIVALFNATWQSTALALAVALALRMIQRTSASTRCAIWTGALLIAIALPAVDYAAARSVPSPQTSDATRTAAVSPASHLIVMQAPKTTARLRSPHRSSVSSRARYPLGHVRCRPDEAAHLRPRHKPVGCELP
ncbi:MAG: hypothetical protein ACR2KS_02105 [Candidatus Eremiobacter antarcticus]|nr:hypothetical protein [Candidatus Eremiobacteraeota bacterium]MBC5809172.1 hypothetical protein [Candidatus Eremiobacteraeota bacterium]